MEEKIIGILGGMGSLATADLFKKIILLTEAGNDNEHIHIIIDNNVNIPDRTKAILKGGESPMPYMLESARFLEGIGVSVIIMPCNTAHYYISELQEQIKVPFINMVKVTVDRVKENGFSVVGLLATDGTCKSGIYKTEFKKVGIKIVTPSKKNQRFIMETIYGIKAQNYDVDISEIKKILEDLKNKGAEGVVLGCTELPIVFQNIVTEDIIFDSTRILAQSAITFVGKSIKREKDMID
jgi:aspartate racemase